MLHEKTSKELAFIANFFLQSVPCDTPPDFRQLRQHCSPLLPFHVSLPQPGVEHCACLKGMCHRNLVGRRPKTGKRDHRETGTRETGKQEHGKTGKQENGRKENGHRGQAEQRRNGGNGGTRQQEDGKTGNDRTEHGNTEKQLASTETGEMKNGETD